MTVSPDLGERFLPLRLVGSGGMAEIWLVDDRETGTVQVAKVVPESGNSQTRDLLEREFEIGRRLDHPNIVRTIGLYGEESRRFLVLEHVPGTDVGVLAGRPIEETLRVLRDIARALQHVHEQGIVHRDLKPSNILLDESGRPHITDFGIADLLGPDSTDPPLVGGGSRAAVSPQQLDGVPATVADDLYSFGALIQHLVTGAPPLGPNPSDQQIRTAEPRPLRAAWPLPQQLQDLVSSLLAKDPTNRPRDMVAVADTLDTVLSAATDRTAPPREHRKPTTVNISPPPRADTIRPMPVAVGGPKPPRGRYRPLPPVGWITAAALALLVAILAFVVFVLPGIVKKQPKTANDTPATAGPNSSDAWSVGDESESTLVEPAALAAEARLEFARQRQAAEAMGVLKWAEADFLNAISRGDDGEARLTAGEYEESASAYSEGAIDLADLVERGTEVLAQALSDGDRALETGESAAAVEAFELALAIDGDNPRARGGLARAEVQDDVLALLERGALRERAGDHASAAVDYRSALRLDPESVDARNGVDRTSQKMVQDDFSLAMSKGLTALDHGKFSEARTAFFEARRLRPDAPEVIEGLQLVDRVERRQTLAELRRKAEDAEAIEDWQTAAGLYDQVLAVDSNLAFAMAGRQRCGDRLELSNRIDFHLTHPERLVSDDVLADAGAVLAAARTTEPRGPGIDRQTAILEDLVAAYSVVVPVSFRSDSLTDVVIYKVGRLGTFTAKTLEMRPGTYTVVGSRPGYRDVRIQLRIPPGTQVPPVIVRCEEVV